MKLHDYRQTIAYMKRRGFANGTPPPKPVEPKRTFNEKIETFSEAAPFVMPRSGVAILKGYLDDALKDGEITQEEHTQALMPLFGETGEMITEQIEKSDRENFAEGTKTKLVEFVENFVEKNNRPPTIMEVADGAKSSTASIRKYLEEGVDFVKTDLSEVGKKGGTTSGAGKKTGVTKLNDKAYKELQDLRIKGVSFQVDTGVGGSKGVRVTIQDPNVSKAFFGDKKTLSFTADVKGIEQAKNLVKQVAISEVYSDNVLPFQTDEYKRKIKRLKAAQYKLKDPFRIYEKLSDYKSEIFPEGMAKKIQIQHGDAKFTTQTLNRMGLIDAAANISPAVEKAERLRNNALKIAMSTLDNPNSTIAAKKTAAEKYNSIAKGLRGQLKGTEGQGLVNFQLLEVDDSGKYKKLKDISFDPKRGLVDSDLDLSKITKEQADDLIARGKKKLDLEAVKLKTGVTTADQLPTPEKTQTKNMFKDATKRFAKIPGLNAKIPLITDLFEMARDIPGDLKRAKYLSAGLKTLGIAATPLVAYDSAKAFGEGKPVMEALEQGFIGTNVIGGIKDYVNLSDEAKEAKNIFSQQERTRELSDQVLGGPLGFYGEPDQDVARKRMLQTNLPSETFDAETLNMQSEISEQEAKKIYNQDKKRVAAERAANESTIANTRKIAITNLMDLIKGTRFQEQPIPQEFMATGGRAGFADGPDDPSKRKFIKIGAGLMSLPFIGKYFKAGAPVAEKTVEVIKRGADGIPDFIFDLITKVKLKAETTGMKFFTGKSSDEFADVAQADNFVVTTQGNKTTVKQVDDKGDMGYSEKQMELEYDPETGGYTYNEVTARPDGDGKLKDIEEFIDDTDLEDMKKYTYDE